MRNKLFWLLSGLAHALILASCGKVADDANETTSAAASDSAIHLLPNGDMQEETASLADMPAFLSEESKTVQLAYSPVHRQDIWRRLCGSDGHADAECLIHFAI